MLLRRGLGQIAAGGGGLKSSPHLLHGAPCSSPLSTQPPSAVPWGPSSKEVSSETPKCNARGACSASVRGSENRNGASSNFGRTGSRSIRADAEAGEGGSTSKPAARKSKLQVMLEEKQAKSEKKKLERAMQKERERNLKKEGRSASKKAAPSEFTVVGAVASPNPEATLFSTIDQANDILVNENEPPPAMPRKLSQAERERERQQQQAYGMRSPEEVPRRGDLARFVLPPLSIPAPTDPYTSHVASANSTEAISPHQHAISSNTSIGPTTPAHPTAQTPVQNLGNTAYLSKNPATMPGQPTPASAASISEPPAPEASPSPSESSSLPPGSLQAASPQATTSQPAQPAQPSEAAAAVAVAAPVPSSENMGSSSSSSGSQAWCNFPVSLPLLSLHPLFERASAYYSRGSKGLTNQQEWEMPPLPWKPWKKRGGELRRLSGVHQALIVEDKDDLPQAVRWLEQDLWPHEASVHSGAATDATDAGGRSVAPPTTTTANPNSTTVPASIGLDADTEDDSAVPWCSSAFGPSGKPLGLSQNLGRWDTKGARTDNDLEALNAGLLGSRFPPQVESEGPGLSMQWDEVRADKGGQSQEGWLPGGLAVGEGAARWSQDGPRVRDLRGVGVGDELPGADSEGSSPLGGRAQPAQPAAAVLDALSPLNEASCESKDSVEDRDWRRGGGWGASVAVTPRLAGSAEEGAGGPDARSEQEQGSSPAGPTASSSGSNSSSNDRGIIRSGASGSSSSSSSSGVGAINSLVGRRGFQRLFRLELEPHATLGTQGNRSPSDASEQVGSVSGSSTELQGSEGGAEDFSWHSRGAEGSAMQEGQQGGQESGEPGKTGDGSKSSWGSVGSTAASRGSTGDADPPPFPSEQQQQQQQQHWQDEPRPRPVIGLDIEWDPTYRPGERSPMALLQLAGPSRCLLLRIQAMQDTAERQGESFQTAAAPLVGLLTRADVVVASIGWNTDEQRKMESALGITRADMPGFVDMQKVAEASGINRVGLNSLAIQVLGAPEGWVKGSKSVTQSKWSKDLSDRQISYAATDAFMAADVYKQLRLLHHAEPPIHCAFCSQPLLGRSPTSQICCPIPGCRRRLRAPIQMDAEAGRSGSSSSSSSGGDVSSSGDESGSEDGSEGSVGAADACYVWRTPTFTSVKGYQKHLAHHAEEVANDPTLSQVEEKTCVQCGRSQFLLASARA